MLKHTEDPLVFNTAINRTKYAQAGNNESHCPFCETASLTHILATEGDKIWLMNKYPTIEKTFMTVLIESAEHLGDISTSSQAENRSLFRFALDCWQQTIDSGKYKSVLMFKNFGPMSGGSLRHPHLQIVGLETVDGYEEVGPENFQGLEIKSADGLSITISDQPIMGWNEINVILVDRAAVDQMADAVQAVTHYLLTDFMNGRCKSYNLFFYQFDGQTTCKIVPRFLTSPYFIGYKIPQVNKIGRLQEMKIEIERTLTC